MTKEQIIEGNKLIAEFMGLVPNNTGWYDGFELYKAGFPFHYGAMGNGTRELKFNTSWDWLMPVVQKIYDMRIEEEPVLIIRDALADASIRGTYDAVIDFIEWYDKQE